MITRSFPLIPSVTDSLFSDRFSRIDQLFSRLTGNEPLSSAPSYDIRKIDESHFDITVGVPGWSVNDIEILLNNGQLTITGKKEEDKNEGYLHRGVFRSSFNLNFSLPDYVKVQNAELKDGLLTVNLLREIPESEKAQKIAINYVEGGSTKAIEHKS